MFFFFMSFLLMFFWCVVSFFMFIPGGLRLVLYFVGNLFFLVMFILNGFFNKSLYWYQYLLTFYKALFFNIDLSWGFDILSLNLILLSSFLLLVCFLSYWHLKYQSIYYFYLLLLSLWILMNVFSTIDFFYFFLFFELIVMPMFFLMGIWGSRNRKISASYQLFLYTLFGSMFMFIVIFDIFLSKGNLSFDFFYFSLFFEKREFFIWFFLFLGFSMKIPMVPFHLWLPEAHVEAPTPGSIMLAGILLKLGSYAILRFLLGSFTLICYDLIFFILLMALFSLTYSSLVALCQMDMKKMIAYSSMAHMNYSLIGLFSLNLLGLAGSYMMMYSHALVSSALFFGMGVLYDSYKTRLLFYYGGLVSFMPIFSIFYFILILSNFGFPGTFNFIGEFFLTMGALYFSYMMTFLTTFSLILSLVYSLFLYNRLFFGFMKIQFMRFYNDLMRLEYLILIIFIILVIFYGIFPFYIFDMIYLFIYKLKFFII